MYRVFHLNRHNETSVRQPINEGEKKRVFNYFEIAFKWYQFL